MRTAVSTMKPSSSTSCPCKGRTAADPVVYVCRRRPHGVMASHFVVPTQPPPPPTNGTEVKPKKDNEMSFLNDFFVSFLFRVIFLFFSFFFFQLVLSSLSSSFLPFFLSFYLLFQLEAICFFPARCQEALPLLTCTLPTSGWCCRCCPSFFFFFFFGGGSLVRSVTGGRVPVPLLLFPLLTVCLALLSASGSELAWPRTGQIKAESLSYYYYYYNPSTPLPHPKPHAQIPPHPTTALLLPES